MVSLIYKSIKMDAWGKGNIDVKKNKVVFEKVVDLAHRLSVLDKLRLIENLTRDIETCIQSRPIPRRHSLRGLLKGSSISGEEIDQARQEMWGNFPREDL